MAVLQSLTFNTLFTLFIISLIVIINNYFILKSQITNGIIIIFILTFFVNLLLGYYISFNSAMAYCGNHFNSVCFWKGIKQACYTTLVYIIVFFWSCPKSGFIGLMGDTFFSNTLAEIFIVGLSGVAITIDNYFRSIEQNCKLDFDTSAAAWKRIEKKLNVRKKNKGLQNLVEIKN